MTNKSDSPHNAAREQHVIMTELAKAALAFYETLEIGRSTPIATGYAGTQPKFTTWLPAVRTAEADGAVVEGLRATLHQFQCDGLGFIHPVDLEPMNPDADPVEGSSRQGVLLEVQKRGLPTFMRMMPLKRRASGKNTFNPPVPVTGYGFGVTYPDLFDDQMK